MSNLKFIIDGQKVDIDKNIDFTRIYRGLETADAKKNNYSLTVKFPFTYTNDLIFKRTNSLTYKSNFPYDSHTCDVSSNGVVLISKANLVLLSTTDSYECSMTWDDFDIIGSILNNPTMLSEAMSEFPFVDWNFDDTVTSWTYSSGKVDTYGIVPYSSLSIYYSSPTYFPDGKAQFFSLPHPIINFYYLLSELFLAIGITVNIPTDKIGFLSELIVRPNERKNNYRNNVFKCWVFWPDMTVLSSQTIYLMPSYKNITYLDNDKNLGNNSFYFKVETLDIDGIDDINSIGTPINIYDPVNDTYIFLSPKQFYRITCLHDCTTTLTITSLANKFEYTKIYKYDSENEVYVYLDQFNFANPLSPTNYTLKKGDFIFFVYEFHQTDMEFELEMSVTLDPNLSNITTDMAFPSLFHIPSGIPLTVGQLVTEALNFTGSQLTYDVNTNSFSFSEKTKQNAMAYDITKNIKSVKEISYDKKYLFNKSIGQNNYYTYNLPTPIDGDHNQTFNNTNLSLEVTQVKSSFHTSSIEVWGEARARENQDYQLDDYTEGLYNIFTKQPLHILWNDKANNRVVYLNSEQNWSIIFDLFYTDWFEDLESRILSGSIRAIKFISEITDIEFKRVNTKGLVYIKTYGKFYNIIEVAKNGDYAEFFLLELF